MKKTLLVIALVIVCMFNMVGCAKLVKTETSKVSVEVVGEYHSDTYIINSNVYPETNEITVSYNGQKYTIDNETIYEKHHKSIGKAITATLETRFYDDGTMKYDIISLD